MEAATKGEGMRGAGTIDRYDVRVQPDGKWCVEHISGYDVFCHTQSIASGKAVDQLRGELAARCAIEDHKAERAKQRVAATGVRSFSVKA